MTILSRLEAAPEPVAVRTTDDELSVDLADGRSITVPLAWFPRLLHATRRERGKFELGRIGVHWPDVDEDIPVAGLLNGEKSGESLRSIQRWLEQRKTRPIRRAAKKRLK